MSSSKTSSHAMRRAEAKFREAFERLKKKRGARITQNNVAREAGTIPSALRRSRFPELVAEIQAWIEQHDGMSAVESPTQKAQAKRAANRDLREQIARMKVQRDDALGKLVTAEAAIVELTIENARLKALLPANSPAPIRPAEKGHDKTRPDLRVV